MSYRFARFQRGGAAGQNHSLARADYSTAASWRPGFFLGVDALARLQRMIRARIRWADAAAMGAITIH